MQGIELLPIIVDHIVVFIGSCSLGAAAAVAVVALVARANAQPVAAQEAVRRAAGDAVFAELHVLRVAHGTQVLGGNGLASGASLMDHGDSVWAQEFNFSVTKCVQSRLDQVRARWSDA